MQAVWPGLLIFLTVGLSISLVMPSATSSTRGPGSADNEPH